MNLRTNFLLAGIGLLLSACATDPLPSWNDTTPKQAIVEFVDRVTDRDSPDFVPGNARIAVFDNDGTLWSEQPLYFQALFIFDRIRTMAPEHPEWQHDEPFASVLRGDMASALAGGEHALIEMAMATHADTTTWEFREVVADWIATARHPTSGRPYTAMVYQPMLEVMDYLRSKGFRTFIVSGGGVDFMRAWAEDVYGIPPEQVIGSRIAMAYEVRDGKPVLVRIPTMDFINDKAGKPIGIEERIGRRPLMAFGNSDGDFEMLDWSTSGPGPGFGLVVHHTDGDREWAYDRNSSIGRLSRGLDEGPGKGWVIVDMKNDWNVVHPVDRAPLRQR